MPNLRIRSSSSSGSDIAPAAIFSLFSPSVLQTDGYAYGKVVDGGVDDEGMMQVSRLNNGRWASLPVLETSRPLAEIQGREVTADEAHSGIGTYVGCCVCIARLLPQSPRVWDYGVVTDYTWDTNAAAGTLHITFSSSNCVRTVSIKYALDFSYFSGNNRRRPQRVTRGDTIFSEPQAPTAAVQEEPPTQSDAAVVDYLPGQLSDSDDSDSSLSSERRGQEVPHLREPKRVRDGFGTDNDDIQSLKRLKMSYLNNPSMLRSIDQLIAVRESSVSSATTSDLVGFATSTTSASAQFRPSATQRTVHRQLVNGTYALMDAQLLLETIQVQHEQFSFLLHPSILRAMFSWEFGLRRLSIMHFAPVTEYFRRNYSSTHDMTDFSRSSALAQALVPAHLSDVIDALDCLGLAVNMVFLPYVSDLVDAARKLVVLLKSQQGFTSAIGRGELVHWINGRLERFRGRLALQHLEEAKAVRLQFSVSDPSFIRVTQIITAACVQELRAQQVLPQQLTAPPQSRKSTRGKAALPSQRVPVPQSVLDALPTLNGKSLCMRYLSKSPCPSRSEGCYAKKRGHFTPESLPDIVFDFIQHNYGGLKEEFAAVKQPKPPDVVQPSTQVPFESILCREERSFTSIAESGNYSVDFPSTAPEARGVGADVMPQVDIGEARSTVIGIPAPLAQHGHEYQVTHRAGKHARQNDDTHLDASESRQLEMAKAVFLQRANCKYMATFTARQRLLDLHRDRVAAAVASALQHHGIQLPSTSPRTVTSNGTITHLIDREKQRAYSTFIRRSKMQLPEFVRLIRGETSEDPRPNKGLEIPSHVEGWSSSLVGKHCDARATSCLNELVEKIRKGQDSDKYLVLDIDLLAELEGITCSFFGAVEKSSPDTSHQVHAIHDLSYPDFASVNDNTAVDDSVIVTYDGHQALARRILEVEDEFPDDAMILSDNVRHLGDRSVLSIWLAALAAALLDGWSSNYAPLCGISTNMASPAFGSGNTVRFILGPEAINEEKFTLWFKRGKALGLLWDIPNGSLAMPRDKVAKALGRVNALLESTVTSRSQVYKLLESLRHVVTCVRSGTPFFQSLAALTYSTRRSVQIPVTDAVRDDLNWFRIILGAADLNSIPLSRFTNSQRVDFDIYMDASNYGLCALFPARREFLQVQFDEMELQSIEEFRCTGSGDLGINLRELMSAAFASIVWCKYWTGTSRHHLKHVRFWIDNKAAVSWNNRRSSRNKTAQTVLRILSVLETINSFYTTAEHISGADNTMADADRECADPSYIKETLQSLGALLRAGALAESSRTHYQRYWKQWIDWCRWMSYPEWLSDQDNNGNASQLGSFVVFLWRYGMNKSAQGNTYSTICAKLCAVRWYHKNNLGYDPGDNASHAILLRGIRRFTKPVAKQYPLSLDLLKTITSSLNLQEARSRLLWGGILLGYFFLLRRSEYLCIGSKHHGYIIRLQDISLYDKAGRICRSRTATPVGIRLTGAKNNQFGREEVRYHEKSGDATICPVLAARWIFKGAKEFNTRPEQPALSINHNTAITAKEVANVIKRAAEARGMDSSRFLTHSVRIGGATALLNAGADKLAIKLLGRWMSSAYEDYPVLTAQGTPGMSRLMC
ncbi:hypothetical protein L916_13055 [Phytophthora nicotianae]|uniref:Tyr recombinase domain-containing protein n=1 Tax=Phytophthora nicotianae TaxID=4792 RepID=W2IL02_PHYNI|nr:hypothetical protein L916_13055 [Phytophthora nicotianae]